MRSTCLFELTERTLSAMQIDCALCRPLTGGNNVAVCLTVSRPHAGLNALLTCTIMYNPDEGSLEISGSSRFGVWVSAANLQDFVHVWIMFQC